MALNLSNRACAMSHESISLDHCLLASEMPYGIFFISITRVFAILIRVVAWHKLGVWLVHFIGRLPWYQCTIGKTWKMWQATEGVWWYQTAGFQSLYKLFSLAYPYCRWGKVWLSSSSHRPTRFSLYLWHATVWNLPVAVRPFRILCQKFPLNSIRSLPAAPSRGSNTAHMGFFV